MRAQTGTARVPESNGNPARQDVKKTNGKVVELGKHYDRASEKRATWYKR